MVYTCLDCKHFVHSDTKVVGRREVITGVFEPVTKEIPRHCTKCNDVMLAWFEKYGNVPTKKLIKDNQPPCFEPKEFLKSLDEANAIAQKLLEEIEK